MCYRTWSASECATECHEVRPLTSVVLLDPGRPVIRILCPRPTGTKDRITLLSRFRPVNGYDPYFKTKATY